MSSSPPMRGRRGWERRLADQSDQSGPGNEGELRSANERPAFDSAEAEIEAHQVDTKRRAEAVARSRAAAPGTKQGAGRRLPNLSGLPPLLAATGAFATLRERLGDAAGFAASPAPGGRHAGVTSVPW